MSERMKLEALMIEAKKKRTSASNRNITLCGLIDSANDVEERGLTAS